MPPCKLLELVYEGGDVLDVALARQRRVLRDSLGGSFCSLDLRRMNTAGRGKVLRAAADREPRFVLLRGLHNVEEALPFFPRARLFLDYLARLESVPVGSLARWSFRTTRVFAYSEKADADLRRAGVGVVSTHPGPFLPDLDLEDPRAAGPEATVGIAELGQGAFDVLVRLKKVCRAQKWPIEIVSTKRIGGAVQYVDSIFDLAEQSDLLVVPMDMPDFGGPHEGALLAMAARRALCTSATSALYLLPWATGAYIPGERYSPGSYAAAYGVYRRDPARYSTAFDALQLDAEAVPKELLGRM